MARRAPARGRMRHEDELCIQKHILEIEAVIEAKDLTGPLFSRKVIDMDDMEVIQAGDTRPERARRFINILVLRGQNSLHDFIESLEVMGYKDLADKLKGSMSSVRTTSLMLKDEEKGNSLNEEVVKLKRRLKDVELTGAKMEDLDVLRGDVNGELKNLTTTLQKIEELSRVSRETVTTINALTKQLDEKEQLLAAARQQIKELESKVSVLEQENKQLKRTLEKQQKQIASLTHKMSRDRRETDRRLEAEKMEREKDRREIHEKMESDKEKMMNVVHSLAQQLDVAKKDKYFEHNQNTGGLRVKAKPIIPRNRFQNGGAK